MVVGETDEVLLPVIVLLPVGQVVRSNGLFLLEVAAVFLIAEDLQHHGAAPFAAAGKGLVSRLPQFPGDHRGSLSLIDAFVENQPDKLRPGGIHRQLPVLHIITQQGAAEDHSLFHAPGLPPLHPL